MRFWKTRLFHRCNFFCLPLSGLLLLFFTGSILPAAEKSERPNIVMIISDDQAFHDFGFMGHEIVQTPHIDRLAQQSARYPNGYVPSSVCRPSLATLLTGLYPHQHGIHFNHPPDKQNRHEADYLIRSVPTLPRILEKAGYKSFQTGKYWEGHYSNAGFTDGMTRGKPADIENPLGLRKAHGNGDAGLAIGRKTMQPIYDFIEGLDDEPFLLWYAPYLPHTPHRAPKRFVEMYEDHPDVPEHFVKYYASCSWFDHTVGRLIDFLDKKKLSKNTIFVFVSDNGWEPSRRNDQRPILNSKRSPFEIGLRTPILIRWDDRVQPATHKALVNTIDIVPTLLAALDLESEVDSLPGVNLLPSALGREELKSRPVFGEIYPGDASVLGNPARDVSYRWVRSGDFKLIVPHLSPQGNVYRNYLKEPALYNVAEDLREKNDLSADPRYADKMAELKRLLDRWWKPKK